MQKTLLSYTHYVEDPFNPEAPEFDNLYWFKDGMYDGADISGGCCLEGDEDLSYLKEIREIIKRDMNKILECYIRKLNNNDGLVKELENLIESIDNGQDYNFFSNHNYFLVTDNYLCFNNFENFIDELELGALGSDAETYETIVIIDQHIKNFYFIRITNKLLAVAESTTINAYSIKDKNVKKRKVNFKKRLTLSEYTDEGIKKILRMVA